MSYGECQISLQHVRQVSQSHAPTGQCHQPGKGYSSSVIIGSICLWSFPHGSGEGTSSVEDILYTNFNKTVIRDCRRSIFKLNLFFFSWMEQVSESQLQEWKGWHYSQFSCIKLIHFLNEVYAQNNTYSSHLGELCLCTRHIPGHKSQAVVCSKYRWTPRRPRLGALSRPRSLGANGVLKISCSDGCGRDLGSKIMRMRWEVIDKINSATM